MKSEEEDVWREDESVRVQRSWWMEVWVSVRAHGCAIMDWLIGFPIGLNIPSQLSFIFVRNKLCYPCYTTSSRKYTTAKNM